MSLHRIHFRFLFSPPIRTVQFSFNCTVTPLLLYVVPAITDAFILSRDVRYDSLFDTSPCPLLLAIVLQLFLTRDHLDICGRQHFASVLETR